MIPNSARARGRPVELRTEVHWFDPNRPAQAEPESDWWVEIYDGRFVEITYVPDHAPVIFGDLRDDGARFVGWVPLHRRANSLVARSRNWRGNSGAKSRRGGCRLGGPDEVASRTSGLRLPLRATWRRRSAPRNGCGDCQEPPVHDEYQHQSGDQKSIAPVPRHRASGARIAVTAAALPPALL